MLTIRNLILCILVPVALVVGLQRNPHMLDRALGYLPIEHAPRVG